MMHSCSDYSASGLALWQNPGAIVKDRTMVLPYAVADSFTAFSTLSIDNLLAVME
jgi:hypothetical protein